MAEIISIHQPNYLPWIGYFHKILTADTFVFLDTVEFSSDSVTHRNKIKTPDGEHWLTVPISSSSSTTIADLEIDTSQRWQRSHRKSIEVHYANAPYFEEHSDLLEVYDQREWSNLASLNVELIRRLTDTLDLDIRFVAASELSADGSGTERLVELCTELGAETYFSGEGARDYHDETLFEQAGIKLVYQDIIHPEYQQQFGEFFSHLSIVDMLFNVGADRARKILNGL
jgi:hypothetical protein